MITRVIYDTTGLIISQMQGSDLPVITGIPYLDVEIPEGKYIISIDMSVTPHVPIYNELPKSEIDLLQERIITLEEDALDSSAVLLDLLIKFAGN